MTYYYHSHLKSDVIMCGADTSWCYDNIKQLTQTTDLRKWKCMKYIYKRIDCTIDLIPLTTNGDIKFITNSHGMKFDLISSSISQSDNLILSPILKIIIRWIKNRKWKYKKIMWSNCNDSPLRRFPFDRQLRC